VLETTGQIKVDQKQSRIVVELSADIIRYYSWFVSKEYWINLQSPKYGAHVTIGNEKIHKDIDWKKAIAYNGKKIKFQYDHYLIRGGYTKGFIMFYLKVYSEELDKMKKELKIIDNDGFRGLHITLGHSGKSDASHMLYWPKMIEIK
jgi:hypothetical protein